MTLAGVRHTVIAALGALLVPACTGTAPSSADAGPNTGDGGVDVPDAPTSAGGLDLQFKSDPNAPATLGGTYQCVVSTVKVELKNVRAVGDAAPGDARTSIGELQLNWPGTNPAVPFPEAPPGMYSFVLANLDEYHLQGTVVVNSVSHPFDIKDEDFPSIGLSIPVNAFVLTAGVTKELDVHLDLTGFLLGIAWGDATVGADGVIHIDGSTSFINDVRDALQQAFGSAGDDNG